MSNKNINALSHDKPTIATERPSPKIKLSGSGSKGKGFDTVITWKVM